MIRLAIYLGNHTGNHRRSRRRLHELHACVVPIGDGLKFISHPQTDGVAL